MIVIQYISKIIFGGDFLKNKIIMLACFALCACFLLASCAPKISVLEDYCFAVARFDLEKAAECTVSGDAEKYFETVLELSQSLTEEQRGIAKELFSQMKFTDFAEGDGFYTVTVKYIDFSALIKSVNDSLAVGTGTASDYLREIIDSGRIQNQFLKTEQSVKVVLAEADGKAKLALGYSGENARFTALVGLDTFLRWYSTKR